MGNRSLQRWAFVFGWLGVILLLSSPTFSFRQTLYAATAALQPLGADFSADILTVAVVGLRKAAHVTEFAVLTLLLWAAFNHGWAKSPTRPTKTLRVFCAVALCAALDEWWQTQSYERTGRALDVAVDLSGCVLTLAYLHLRFREPSPAVEHV